VFHYFFRKKFLLISTDHAKAEASGLNVRFWDFLFYASFGFVVTSSVAIAGVLLVFCYLIVPSVGAMLFADRVGRRLAIGWTMGTLVSALGVYFSVLLDLPTGATIVCTFGGVLILMFLVHLIFFQSRAQPLEGATSAAGKESVWPALTSRQPLRGRIPDTMSRSTVQVALLEAVFLSSSAGARLGF
jgi:zinc/manganese transport system permease protein